MDINQLLNEKAHLEVELNSLICGSIEIRNDKYLYVHYRKDISVICKYVDLYSKEKYEELVKNNIRSKDIKKRLREINKILKDNNICDISEKIKLNIDFAKSNLVNTIYKQAKLEGITATYADTENIIEGGIINNMNTDDVLKIINLKHAWEFILSEGVILSPTDFNLLCKINKIIENNFFYNAGILRSTPVSIGGSNYKPNIPIEVDIKKDIDKIVNNKRMKDIDKAIELIIYIMKKQLFIDGNKRSAIILANHYLISKGLGIIAIPEKYIDMFKMMLIEYYEQDKDNIDVIRDFIKEYCYINI